MIYQLPLFKPTSTWEPTPINTLPSWAQASRIGIDIETFDPGLDDLGPGPRRDGRIIGVSFAIEDGPSYYLPVGHSEDNLDPGHVFAYLRDQAKCFHGVLVGANINYDLDFLAEAGVWFDNVQFFRDVQVADPLINELHNRYSLQAISERWGLAGKDEIGLREAAQMYGLKNPKSQMFQLPARYVADYAVADAELPLKISRKQEREIDNQDLWDIYNLESRVLPVLVKMRRRGVRIDLNKLEEVEQWCLAQEKEALAQVKHLTGVDVPVGGVWQAKALVPVLEYIGINIKRTAKGAPNIDKFVLDGIDHPAAEAVAWARKTNKLRTTFAKSIRTHMVKDRIHCVFNQLAREDEEGGGIKGARYGRLSSEHPNMQQQPARDEFAKMWRSIYVPDTDHWASLDYSQQEPRVLTHYAWVCKLTRAAEAGKRYCADPNTDNHQLMTELIYGKDVVNHPKYKEYRTYCKQIFLGLCYGMGGAKLARKLGLDTKMIKTRQERWVEVAGDEAQAILDQFDQHAPYVRELADECKNTAESRGYIVTLGGRHCRFPKDEAGNYDWCHKALNRLIQGTSADQTKTAMVEADRAGHELQLQVHDELDLSVVSREQAEEIAEIMRTCMPLRVPSKVDVEIGPNWGEVK